MVDVTGGDCPPIRFPGVERFGLDVATGTRAAVAACVPVEQADIQPEIDCVDEAVRGQVPRRGE